MRYDFDSIGETAPVGVPGGSDSSAPVSVATGGDNPDPNGSGLAAPVDGNAHVDSGIDGEAQEDVYTRRQRVPEEPTQAERDAHADTCEPYRSWCDHCVAGRGRSDKHSPGDHRQDALAVIGMDYGYLGAEECATPLLCARDSKHRWYYGIPLPRKGDAQWSVERFVEELRRAGHSRMVLRCD